MRHKEAGGTRQHARHARLVIQDRVAWRGHTRKQREVRVVARIEEQRRLVAVERGQPRLEPLVFRRVAREKARSRRADQLLLRATIGPEPLPLREHFAVQHGVARKSEVVVRAEVDCVGRCRATTAKRDDALTQSPPLTAPPRARGQARAHRVALACAACPRRVGTRAMPRGAPRPRC